MAKTYAFRFTARRAEFSKDGFVGIRFGGADTVCAREDRDCTLAEALAYLHAFSAAAPGPHAAILDMRSFRERKPPGFDAATTRPLYKKAAAAASATPAPAAAGRFSVMIDYEQTAAGPFETIEAAREAGQALADAEPLPCTFTVADEGGATVATIERTNGRDLSAQIAAFNEARDANDTEQSPAERDLYRCLANDLQGLHIDPCPDLRGFVLRDPATRRAMFTAYVAEGNAFSSYLAIADDKGYDLADERPLAIRAPLFTAVAKIKDCHRTMNPNLYRGLMERDAGYRAGFRD